MKKRIAVLLSFIIGFTCCYSAITLAAETEVQTAGAENDSEKPDESNEKEQNVVEDKEMSAQNKDSLTNIQIPEKLNVVIDPWEIDQKGQIYSEEYVIKNTGDVSGILTLSDLACKPEKHSGVIVKKNKKKIHDGEDKSIYIEMLFGKKERIVLSQESSQYQTELKPGEELAIRFSGEVNENAVKTWEGDDIAISAIYSWEVLEDSEPDPAEPQAEKEMPDDVGENIPEKEDLSDSDAGEKQEQEPETADIEKDESESIELQEAESKDIVIDNWKVEENGWITSQQYQVQNTGVTSGTLNLSEIVCEPKKESKVTIKTEKDRLHENEDTAVFMELVLGKGEKIVLSQEDAQYKVILEPGEMLSICCIGEMNGNLFENYKDGDIVVSATYTWDPE